MLAESKNISISPKSLNFSRDFVVQSARQSRSARGHSSYRKESIYSHMQVNLRVYSELFSARLFIKQCQSCGKNHPASPRASHYKTKEMEKILSKLNFFYFLCFALLHFSRYFVVQPARQSRSARGRSPYRKELTYSHMQVNLRVYSELFSALLNIFASTPSRNRTYNCPLGGGCYIHLTMRACRPEFFEPEYQKSKPI